MRLFGTIDNTISSSEKVNIVLPPFNLLTTSCGIACTSSVVANGKTISSAILKSTSNVTVSGRVTWGAISSIGVQSKVTATAKNLKLLAATIKSTVSLTAVAKKAQLGTVVIKANSDASAISKSVFRQTVGITSKSNVVAPSKIIRFIIVSLKGTATTIAKAKMKWGDSPSIKGIATTTAVAKKVILGTDSISATSKVAANATTSIFAAIKCIVKTIVVGNVNWKATCSLVGNNNLSASATVNRTAISNITSVSKTTLSGRVFVSGLNLKISTTSLLVAIAKVAHKATDGIRGVSWLVAGSNTTSALATAVLKGNSIFAAAAIVKHINSTLLMSSKSTVVANARRLVPLSVLVKANSVFIATSKYVIRSSSIIASNAILIAKGFSSTKATITSRSVMTATSRKYSIIVVPIMFNANTTIVARGKMFWKGGIILINGISKIAATAKSATKGTVSILGVSNITASGTSSRQTANLKSTAEIIVNGKINQVANVSITGASDVLAPAKVVHIATANIKSVSEINLVGKVKVSISSNITSNASFNGAAAVGSVFAHLQGNCKFLAWTSSYAYADLSSDSSMTVAGNRFATRRSITNGNLTFCNPCASTAFTFKRDGKRYIKNIVNGALAPTLHHQGVSHNVSD